VSAAVATIVNPALLGTCGSIVSHFVKLIGGNDIAFSGINNVSRSAHML